MSQVIPLVHRAESTVRREVITYLILALAIAWSCQGAALSLGIDFNQLDSSPPIMWALLMVGAWAPGLAAMITRLMYHHSLRGLGWGRVQPRFLLLAAVLPLLYTSSSYIITWLLDPGAFAPAQVLSEATDMLGTGWASEGIIIFSYLLLTTVMLIIPIGFFALGEEFGWNGLLVPQLARVTSFGYTTLIFGSAWALFHYPFMLFATGYTQGAPLWYGVVLNTIVLAAVAFTAAWLRLRSGSIWPVVLSHTLWNILTFYIFEPITHSTPLTIYLTGEKGAVTGLIVAAFALLFWRLGRSIDRKDRS